MFNISVVSEQQDFTLFSYLVYKYLMPILHTAGRLSNFYLSLTDTPPTVSAPVPGQGNDCIYNKGLAKNITNTFTCLSGAIGRFVGV